MIERLVPNELPIPATVETQIEVEVIPESEPFTSVEMEDGSVEITIGEEDVESGMATAGFDDNLARHLPEDRLMEIGRDLLDLVKLDDQSREDWKQGFADGLQLLGFKPEERTMPWDGACGLVSTMIPEAVVRFQSNAIQEIFPAEGPVKTKILGKITKERMEQAERVRNRMNYAITEEIPDYRTETEKLLFDLAFIGSAFRKIYPDTHENRPGARYIRAQDFIIPYGASSLHTAPRYTEVLRLFPSDVKRLQASDDWLDVRVNEQPTTNDLQTAIDEVAERKPTNPTGDPGTYYECHTLLDMPEDPLYVGSPVPLPYIVTFDTDGTVVSIRRNWSQNDPKQKKQIHYSAYYYIPAEGPYGYGVLHLIGGSAKAATSIERQLVDAGTLANLPAGYKTKDARMKQGDTPFTPGEFRDVDLSAGTLRDAFYPLPFKEPSQTLLALLQRIEDAGRRLASISEIQVGDMSANAPVGSVLALMEREMKVMTAVQARLHASLHEEFKILARVMRDYGPAEYEYDVEGDRRSIRREDFDDRIDVIPVSDPNAATLSQRITLYQMAVQLAQQAPQLYDMAALHRQMLTIAGIKDVDLLIPDKNEIKPADPVVENMAIVTGKPVKAFEWQDHDAHITSHVSFLQDPQTAATLGQNPQAQAIFAAAQAHIAEHFAYKYRAQIEMMLGVPLPGLDEPLPGDIESQLSVAVAKAAQQLLAKHQQEAANAEAQAKLEDPVIQMQQAELQIKQAEVQRKAQADAARLQAEMVATQTRAAVERERIQAQERMAQDAAIDRGEQFLAKAKLEKPKQDTEIQKMKAQVAEILARIEAMSRGGE